MQCLKDKMKASTGVRDHVDEMNSGVRDIKTIVLAMKAKFWIEKLFWFVVGMMGLSISIYFMMTNVMTWHENSLILQKSNFALEEVNNPAITICSDVSSRYAIAERMGNYVDPENIPEKLKDLEEKLKLCGIRCAYSKNKDCFDENYDTAFTTKAYYIKMCGIDSPAAGCESVEKLYQHSRTRNMTMKTLFQELLNKTGQDECNGYQCLKQIALEYLSEKTGDIKGREDIEKSLLRTNNDWNYVAAFLRLYTKLFSNEDWIVENTGSFFIKSLNLMNLTSINDDMHKSCGNLKNEFLQTLHHQFNNERTNISLMDIAYLYSIDDFTVLLNMNINQYKVLSLFGPPSSRRHNPIPIHEYMNTKVFECVKEVCNKTSNLRNCKLIIADDDLDKRKDGSPLEVFPCSDIDAYPKCIDYCNWHKEYFINNRKNFLTIMKYSKPQRKMTLKPTLAERELSEMMFGVEKVKGLSTHNVPSPLVSLCGKADVGIYGEDIGLGTKICKDFFPTPTDVGICLTKNIYLDKIMKTETGYKEIFDNDSQQEGTKIIGGTLWSETTLVIDTGLDYLYSQNYPTKSNSKMYEISLQLHQTTELAQMNKEPNYKDALIPLKLMAGNEYFIDVKPSGRTNSDAFKNLGSNKRDCVLPKEITETSIFKTYTQNNCKYECLVELSSKICKCKPWDYFTSYTNTTSFGECDIFQRSCFASAMKNLTEEPTNHCPQCGEECEYIRYEKTIQKERKLNFFWYLGQKILFNFLQDRNHTFSEKSFKSILKSFHVTDQSYYTKPYSDLIVIHVRYHQPEMMSVDIKYSVDDIFAKFGGLFGIFSQMTGVTFLCILNLIIISIKILISVSMAILARL